MGPDFEAFPNVFGWFWTLNALTPPSRALYTAGGAKTEAPKKGGKKDAKKAEPAPAPKKADDDDFDLFGDETEEDKAAQAELEKQQKEAEEKKKKAKKVVIAKSLVTFDVKGYEEDQDL